MLNGASRGEDEDLRAVRVGEHDGVTPVLIDESREWIEMWTIGNEQSIAFERRFKQSDYKPIVVS
jgi:predicted RNA-binding Zn ribbon-like protein